MKKKVLVKSRCVQKYSLYRKYKREMERLEVIMISIITVNV